ncbi:MAG: hypothetical protein IPI71_00005 [Methanolinea sp.]|nr:MAG: hypothetical protein IPI71_00005 [Methanolinea sp.]
MEFILISWFRKLTLDRIGFSVVRWSAVNVLSAWSRRIVMPGFVRGLTLTYMARYTDALPCLDHAVAPGPSRHGEAWFIRGISLPAG